MYTLITSDMAFNSRIIYGILLITISIQVIIADNYYNFYLFGNSDGKSLKNAFEIKNANEAQIKQRGI